MERVKITLLTFILISIFGFSQNTSTNNINFLEEKFLNARSLRNIEEMKFLLNVLENEVKKESNDISDYTKAKTLLSEVYFEYAQLINDNNMREKFYNLSLQTAKEIIKIEPQNGKAYYIAAMSCATLIEFVNVFQKLTLLNDFDFYIEKAIRYIQNPIDKCIAYIAKGVRFMSPPWPFYDYKKAEECFKEAQKYESNYSGLYLNWAQLYLKMGDRKRAEEFLRKVLNMEPHLLFIKQHEENVRTAKQLLGLTK